MEKVLPDDRPLVVADLVCLILVWRVEELDLLDFDGETYVNVCRGWRY